MNSFLFVLICSMIIFLSTSVGALFVCFIRKINVKTEKICLGLASGIMFAASIWSLLLPAIESTKYIFVILGFITGILVIIKLDNLVSKYNNISLKKNTMLFIAMTLHNIPEGMTVGLMCAYAFNVNSSITMSMALALTIGISIQNIPEGAAISLNYRQVGYSKLKSSMLGIISGIVEPISAFIMFYVFKNFSFLLPIVLSSAASIMIYVVINDLIPSANKDDDNYCSIYFIIGFIIMMTLDVLL